MFGIDFDNPWIVAADGAARRPAASMALTVTAAMVLATTLGGLALAAALWTGMGASHSATLHAALVYLAVFLPMLTLTWAAGRVWPRAPLAPARSWIAPASGLCAGLGGFGAVLMILAGLGLLKPGGAHELGALTLLGGIALIALQVGAEEALFRGWLQPILGARWGAWAGLGGSSAAFAVAHFVGARWGALATLNLVLSGTVFGLLAYRTGGLWAPFLAHFAWNAVEACGVGLEPNPGVGVFGSAIDLDAVGPALWTGGGDRLNGSLATTLVLLTLALGLGLMKVSRSAPRAGRLSGSARP